MKKSINNMNIDEKHYYFNGFCFIYSFHSIHIVSIDLWFIWIRCRYDDDDVKNIGKNLLLSITLTTNNVDDDDDNDNVINVDLYDKNRKNNKTIGR